ncbi:MAG: hypothetical protein Q9210_004915 [Variospora velana]
MRARSRIFSRPRNQKELDDFYGIVRELSIYGDQVESRIEVEVEKERDRLLTIANHKDGRRLFRDNWDHFMKYLGIHRAYLAFGGSCYEMGEPPFDDNNPTTGWADYVPLLISFGTLIHTKAAPPGAEAAVEADARLWHIVGSGCLGTSIDAATYFHYTLAPSSEKEIQEFNLSDVVPLESDISEWATGLGDAEESGIEIFRHMFQLRPWEDPYERPH